MIRVLVCDQSFQGDVLMSTPGYREIAKHFPSVELLTLPCSKEVAEHTYLFERIHTSWATVKHFDIAIHLHTSLKTNLVMLWKGIPVRVGYAYKWAGLPLTVKVPTSVRTIREGYRLDEVCELLERAFDWNIKDRSMVFL